MLLTLFDILLASAVTQASVTAVGDPLRLTIAADSQTRCAEGNSEVFVEVFTLTVVYVNEGRQPISMYLGSEVLTSTWISRSLADMTAERYESARVGDLLIVPEKEVVNYKGGQTAVNEYLIAIHPKQRVTTRQRVIVEVRRTPDAVKNWDLIIDPGRHFLRIGVALKVPEPTDPSGTTYIDVLSNPVPIEIAQPSNTVLPACGKEIFE